MFLKILQEILTYLSLTFYNRYFVIFYCKSTHLSIPLFIHKSTYIVHFKEVVESLYFVPKLFSMCTKNWTSIFVNSFFFI